MSHLGADLFQCGTVHYLVVVDRYSGFPFVWPLRQLHTTEVVHHYDGVLRLCRVAGSHQDGRGPAVQAGVPELLRVDGDRARAQLSLQPELERLG